MPALAFHGPATRRRTDARAYSRIGLMATLVEPVDEHNLGDFLQYCHQYGPVHDDSYLPGRDFAVNLDHPSYLLLEDGKPAGAVSLIRGMAHRQARRGRFSVFHSLIPSARAYSQLYQAISAHFESLDRVFLFVPRDRQDTRSTLVELGFEVERTSFVLCLENPRPHSVEFGEGFSVVSLKPNDLPRIGEFADTTNSDFRDVAGHMDLSRADVRGWFLGPSSLENGISFLCHDGEPIGSVCILRGFGNQAASEITALSVSNAFRGQGLGRRLLRWAVNFSMSSGRKPIYLSMNGENDSALRLYLSEGFILKKTVDCYEKDVRDA